MLPILLLLSSASFLEPPHTSALETNQSETCEAIGDLRSKAAEWANVGKLAEAQSSIELALRCVASPNLLKVRLLGDLGKIVQQKLNFERADQLYREALALNQHLPQPSIIDSATLLGNLGALATEQHRFPEAEKNLREAHKILEELGELENPVSAAISGDLGIALLHEGKLAESRLFLSSALAMFRKTAGEQSMDYSLALSNMGLLGIEEGFYVQAVEVTEEALSIQRRLQPFPTHQGALLLNNYGIALLNAGRNQAAAQALRQALALQKQVEGRWSVSAIQPLTNLAALERMSGTLSAATEHITAAAQIAAECFSKDDLRMGTIWNTQGMIEASGNHPDRAESLYRRTIGLCSEQTGPSSPICSAALSNLAELESKRHRYGRAKELYQQALTTDTARYGDENPRVANDLNNVAAQLFYLKQRPQALELFQRADAIQQRRLGENNMSTARTKHNIGVVYLAMNKLAEADTAYAKAIHAMDVATVPDRPALEQWLDEYSGLLRREQRFAEAEQAQVRSLGLRVQETLAAEKRARTAQTPGQSVID